MGFWLELGVSGFRMDAAPFLIETKGTERRPRRRSTSTTSTRSAQFLTWRRGDAILLAEANVAPRRDRRVLRRRATASTCCSTSWSTSTCSWRWRASDAEPLIAGAGGSCRRSRRRPVGATSCATTTRSTSGGSPTEERQRRLRAPSAPSRHAALRPRHPPPAGARCWAATARRIELAYSLLFTLPGHAGAPLRRGDRHGRRPVAARARAACARRCSGRRSRTAASPPRDQRLMRPVVADGPFGYHEGVNVEDQRRDPGSLLNWIERLIRTRKECPGDRLGRAARSWRPATPRSSPTAATGAAARCWPCTTWPTGPPQSA